MAWRQVTIGGASFREELLANESDGVLNIGGQEQSLVGEPVGDVYAAHANVRGLRGKMVPVVFGDKSALSGFYLVTGARSELLDYANGSIVTATWQATLERLGTERDLEFESRVPTFNRTTEVAGAPAASYWHAPPGGHDDYLTGATVPSSSVVRTGADGPITVFRGIPVDVAPRWTVAVVDYLRGAARIRLDGRLHLGESSVAHDAWSLSNGLVDVRSAVNGTIDVSVVAPDGALRSTKRWAPSVDGNFTWARPDFTILRNTPEEVVVRLSYVVTQGRVQVDLSLRRGSRFVIGTIKRHATASLGIARTSAEAGTVVTGGIRATSADSDGNRYVVGSSRATGTITTSAWISKGSVRAFDFFLGHEVGASPAAGDAFADLFAQYLGTQSERVNGRAR